ncbi:MAG TPA: cupredoxin domain-containing protein [Gemmatimonadaceae bacterium]|nr:cupredoxin domain-containing protein [Gemmatimonadaceae bacterium]
MDYARVRRILTALVAAGPIVWIGACARDRYNGAAPPYTPVARTITMTTVPLLVKEDQRVLPFLTADFAKGGVLDGKEVYAFSPSTVTVEQGDTIHFVFVNPEDDVHSFVLPDFSVALPPQKTTRATYVARHAGIYTFTCSIPAHVPMMWGQLVVLSPSAVR